MESTEKENPLSVSSMDNLKSLFVMSDEPRAVSLYKRQSVLFPIALKFHINV